MTERRTSDTPLTAVLHGKPADDQIPLAAWWFMAESLRHSVLVRRALEGVASLPIPDLRLEADQARLAGEAALAALDLEPIAQSMSSEDDHDRRQSASLPTLRTTIYNLARLIVRAQPTSRGEARAAVLRHLEMLTSATR